MSEYDVNGRIKINKRLSVWTVLFWIVIALILWGALTKQPWCFMATNTITSGRSKAARFIGLEIAIQSRRSNVESWFRPTNPFLQMIARCSRYRFFAELSQTKSFYSWRSGVLSHCAKPAFGCFSRLAFCWLYNTMVSKDWSKSGGRD